MAGFALLAIAIHPLHGLRLLAIAIHLFHGLRLLVIAIHLYGITLLVIATNPFHDGCVLTYLPNLGQKQLKGIVQVILVW